MCEQNASIELSYKDISLRLHTKDEYYLFFTQINQRLLPNISTITPEFFRQLLQGEKRCLTLLDSRNYYFPKMFLKHSMLNRVNIYKICNSDPIIDMYIPSNCMDLEYMIKVLATLDLGKLLEIDMYLREFYKSFPECYYLTK